MNKIVRLIVVVSLLVSASAVAAADKPVVRLTLSPDIATLTGLPPVLGYGGGMWYIPKTFDWVSPRILQLEQLGVVRIALAWEVLAASSDQDDLERRLESFRLNDFLRQFHARGGEVMITLDAMPRWLASDNSEKRLGNGPAWALSPPDDYAAWGKVVEAVVRHFNGQVGLNAYYEIWNEPDHSFHGSLDNYFELYKYSVQGARRADAAAKVGGPAISDWSATGTGKDQARKEFFVPQFLAYAKRTALPQAGLKELPVDFISWHGFYRDPTRHYEFIVDRMRSWLQQSGYPRATALIDSEWNIAAVPPYPEGDLQGGNVGAAFVASTLMAMQHAGLNRQVFQMMVDPGSEGYSGGTFTPLAVPRASFNVFSMLSMMSGRARTVASTDEWVRALAFDDGRKLYVMVASFPPTEHMSVRSSVEPIPLEHPEMLEPIKRADKNAVLGFFRGQRDLPRDAFNPEGEARMQSFKQKHLGRMAKHETWMPGIELQLVIPGAGKKYANITHYLIDSKHANIQPQLAATQSQLTARFQKVLDQEVSGLAKQGVPRFLRNNFQQELTKTLSIDRTLQQASGGEIAAMRAAQQNIFSEYRQALDEALPPSSLAATAVRLTWSGTDTISVSAEPYSVHLFVLVPH
jgi:hypothetical protein